MNRFIKLRINAHDLTFDEVIEHAKSNELKKGSRSGFDINASTRKRLTITWLEKIVTTKHVESDIFGPSTYDEIKIFSFGLHFINSTKEVILSDPPLAKHKVYAALKLLVGSVNFKLQNINVNETITKLRGKEGWSLVSLEAEPKELRDYVSVSMTVIGHGDLMSYMQAKHPQAPVELKSAVFNWINSVGIEVKITLSQNGLVKSSKELDRDEIEFISDIICYQ